MEKESHKEAHRPSIGRIVHYRLSDVDIDGLEPDGAPLRDRLNGLVAGDYIPAMVVRTWAEPASHAKLVNLRCFPDGAVATLWRTSVEQGDGNGQWTWPPKVSA